jgi:uncharacterized protein (DUF169 family)
MEDLKKYHEIGRTLFDGLKLTTYPVAVIMMSPGMGDRILAGVQDHEMLFSVPEDQLESVVENLFLAGNKLQEPSPFRIPHPVPTMGANRIFDMPVEPPVWPTLRDKMKKGK